MKLEGKPTIEKFLEFINEHKRLDIEYQSVRRIPFYHFWKQMGILDKMEKLTNDWDEYMKNNPIT